MIYGIADVGSNTVRLSIYKCEGGEIRLLMNRKVMAGLAGYVRHGALTPEGIEVACQTLQGYRSLMDNLELPDLRVFATASLRNISNTEEAVGAVMAATGLRVDVLSGREEAELSFRGAIQNAGLYTGLLADLGGGSTELVSYRNRAIKAHAACRWAPCPCSASTSPSYTPPRRSGGPSAGRWRNSWSSMSPSTAPPGTSAAWAAPSGPPARWPTPCSTAPRGTGAWTGTS